MALKKVNKQVKVNNVIDINDRIGDRTSVPESVVILNNMIAMINYIKNKLSKEDRGLIRGMLGE